MKSIVRLAFGLVSMSAVASDADLTVYTYDSFTSDWGPGPKVEEVFEKRCACDIELVGIEDGVALLNRLKIEGDKSKADIVLGIDTNLSAEARRTGLFAEHGIQPENLSLPVAWSDKHFLPFDYGYFAFVYNTEEYQRPPTSLRQLVEDGDGPAILIQDPRTSTPGLGLLLWMKKIFGDEAQSAWSRLAPRIVTVTKGWSEAYGMFLKNEAPLVLSYTTSPAYHRIAEDDTRFRAAKFEEGHYMQIEVAGVLKSSDNPHLARRFLNFMLDQAFQSIIPTTNWMFPAALPAADLPDGFRQLIDPSPVLIFDDDEIAASRRAWIDEWLEALSR